VVGLVWDCGTVGFESPEACGGVAVSVHDGGSVFGDGDVSGG
jgi:hypothetical protein